MADSDFKYPSQTFIDSLPPQEREIFDDLRTKFEQDYFMETISNRRETGFLRSPDPYAVQHGHDHFGNWLQREGHLGQQGLPLEVLRQAHEYKPEGWDELVKEADKKQPRRSESRLWWDTLARSYGQGLTGKEADRLREKLFNSNRQPEQGIRETEGPGWEMTTPRTPSKKSSFVPFSEIYSGGVPPGGGKDIKPDPWTHAAPREATDKLKSMDPSILKKVRGNPQLRSIFNLEHDPERP